MYELDSSGSVGEPPLVFLSILYRKRSSVRGMCTEGSELAMIGT